MNSKQSATQPSRPQEPDMAPPPTNEPVINLPPGQGAVEAARTGLEDNSDMVGADVPVNSHAAAESSLTADDADAIAQRASTVGEEAIGGTTPTPGQNNPDANAAAAGLGIQPEHPYVVTDEMNRRDDQRFELDPDSKEPQS